MPITATQVDMLLASGGSIVVSVIMGVLIALRNKPFWDFMTHVVDVIDDRRLSKDPERAQRVEELRRARHGNK